MFELGGIIMDINDRGNIKWTSLMLVEHRKKLEELKESEKYKERPELDDQLYELFNYRIKEAFENNVKVKITYYQDHEYKEVNTYIKEYDTYQKKLLLKGKSPKEINFVDIIDISLIS